jgi:hypothetical protein
MISHCSLIEVQMNYAINLIYICHLEIHWTTNVKGRLIRNKRKCLKKNNLTWEKGVHVFDYSDNILIKCWFVLDMFHCVTACIEP